MSKKARIIFLSMVAILIITMATSFVPTSLTFANESEMSTPTTSPTPIPDATGLLYGKTMNYGDYQFNLFGTTDVLTDGNKGTGELFSAKNPSTTWFVFTEDKNIDSVKTLMSDKQTVTVRFYDSNDKEITAYPVPGTGEKYILPHIIIQNVRKVSFTINTRTAYELDVYGQDSTPPIPTATPTPEPTFTPVPTPSATPEVPTGDRAILTVTLTTGLEKEFDLPMSEVTTFLNWYDSASGSTKYGIDKHENNKGPFSKRTEYVVHDKIITFEVSEYTLSK